MINFEWPWLFLALPLPLLVYWLAPAKEKSNESVYAPSLMMLAEEQPKHVGPTSRSVIALLILAWLSFVTALTQPLFIGEPKALQQTDRNMMLAVDISKSMLEEDMQYEGRLVNRLQTVKAVVTDFVQERKGDRLGLILFGERAYIQTPLTFDLSTVKRLLDEAVVGLAGNKTAIGDAIGLGVKRLQDLPESNRVLILLTDGQNTAGEIEPLKAAELAAKAGVKVYAIGIGADEMVIQGFFGPRRVNPSRDLDEDTLTKIATSTGGQYYRARNVEELEQIYDVLNQIEEIESEDKTFRPEKSLLHYPLLLCLAFCMMIYLHHLGWHRSIKNVLNKLRGAE